MTINKRARNNQNNNQIRGVSNNSSNARNNGSTQNNNNQRNNTKEYKKNLNLTKNPVNNANSQYVQKKTNNNQNGSNVVTFKQIKEEEELARIEKMEQFIELRNYLHKMELELKEIPKDGACLFRAVSEFIYFTQEKHFTVRSQCVSFLHENEDSFSPFICSEDCANYATYLYDLSQPYTWGGQLELQALSLLYQTNFLIYSSHITPNPSYLPSPQKTCNSVDHHNSDINNNNDINNINDDNNNDNDNDKKYNVEINSFEIENGFTRTMKLLYSNGNHYDCIYTIPEFQKIKLAQSILYQTILQSIAISNDKPVDENDFKLMNEYQNVGMKVWEKNSSEQAKNDLSYAKELHNSPYLLAYKKDNHPDGDDENGFQSVRGKNKKKKKNNNAKKVHLVDVEFCYSDQEELIRSKHNEQQNKAKSQKNNNSELQAEYFPSLGGNVKKPVPENQITPPATISPNPEEPTTENQPKTWGVKKDWNSVFTKVPSRNPNTVPVEQSVPATETEVVNE